MCPECGVECANGKCTKRQDSDSKCKRGSNKKRENNPEITVIEFLFNNKEGDNIVKKLNDFCYPKSTHNKDKGIEEWKCFYYDDDDNDCETKNYGKDVKGDTKTMPFVDFFQFWVTHLLNDAIEWRKKRLNKCLKNKTGICINKCNSDCKCFERWVSQKKTEWEEVKKHFDKQKNLIDNHHFTILQSVLKEQFLPTIEEAYGDIESMKKN